MGPEIKTERAEQSKIRITRSISIELAEKLDSLQYEGTDQLSFKSKSLVLEKLLTQYFELRAKGFVEDDTKKEPLQ